MLKKREENTVDADVRGPAFVEENLEKIVFLTDPLVEGVLETIPVVKNKLLCFWLDVALARIGGDPQFANLHLLDHAAHLEFISKGLFFFPSPNFNLIFFRLSSDEETKRKKPGMTSSSGISQSDFSSESESPSRRVEFANASARRKSFKSKPFVRHCTLSDSGDWVDPFRKETDGSDSSPSPNRFKRLHPATISLEFEPTSSKNLVIRSAPHVRPRSKKMGLVRRHDLQSLSSGLSRIELAFMEDEPKDNRVRVKFVLCENM